MLALEMLIALIIVLVTGIRCYCMVSEMVYFRPSLMLDIGYRLAKAHLHVYKSKCLKALKSFLPVRNVRVLQVPYPS